MANFNTIDDFDVNGKTVLVRIDINSPVDKVVQVKMILPH